MRKTTRLILFWNILIFAGCKSKEQTTEEAPIKPKVPVEVTTVSNGFVNDNLELFANSAYLTQNTVLAPIPSYITKVYVKLGDKVQQGQTLYDLETKERKALGNQPVIYDSSLAGYGKIRVKASASGIISVIDRPQPGDYVLEGTTLCTITQSNALVFKVNVPFEFYKYVPVGTSCVIVLPDGSKHDAVIVKPLTAMNINSQTQSVLARMKENLLLPEGLVAKVLVNKGARNSSQVLPRECLLSDEMMKEYWVMKMMNDSTAIKVAVIIGNKNKTTVEIRSPQFGAKDQILRQGNYGLPDTALVKVIAHK